MESSKVLPFLFHGEMFFLFVFFNFDLTTFQKLYDLLSLEQKGCISTFYFYQSIFFNFFFYTGIRTFTPVQNVHTFATSDELVFSKCNVAGHKGRRR